MLSCADFCSLKYHYNYQKSHNQKKSNWESQFYFDLFELSFKIFLMKKATELQMSLEELRRESFQNSPNMSFPIFRYDIWELQAHQFSWSVGFSEKYTRVENTHQICVAAKLITWLYIFVYKTTINHPIKNISRITMLCAEAEINRFFKAHLT